MYFISYYYVYMCVYVGVCVEAADFCMNLLYHLDFKLCHWLNILISIYTGIHENRWMG